MSQEGETANCSSDQKFYIRVEAAFDKVSGWFKKNGAAAKAATIDFFKKLKIQI